MNQSSIEIIKAIIRFKTNSFLKLGKSIINLIEHHHTIASISIVLWIFIIKSYSSSKIIHCFLIMSSCHKSITSVCMIFSVCGTFIISWCRLKASNSFTEFLDCRLCVSFILFFVIFLEEFFTLVVELKGKFLLLNLIAMI